jgi:hypothetical protein
VNRWKIIKRNNQWRVYDRDLWHETHDTLVEAHTAATQLAVTTMCFEPGGLTILKYLRAGEALANWEMELILAHKAST